MSHAEDNLRVWNQVCKTNPKYTKNVSIGRKFTSVDGQYVLQKATEALGPIGVGWSWSAQHSILELGKRTLAVCDVTVLVGEQSWGPVRAMNEVISEKGRFDEDAPKKAMTDALTKALSHLGVAADVYLGMFDDNKYVAQLRSEHAENSASSQVPSSDRSAPSETPVKPLSKTQIEEINRLAQLSNTDTSKIANAFAVETLDEIQAGDYDRIIATLKRKIEGLEKAGGQG